MKAEDRALKAYPKDIEEFVDVNGLKSVVDNNSWQRTIFLNGYHQAEKDLELTWKDLMFIRLAFDVTEANINLGAIKIQPMTKEYYQEVLKRFKDFRERKKK